MRSMSMTKSKNGRFQYIIWTTIFAAACWPYFFISHWQIITLGNTTILNGYDATQTNSEASRQPRQQHDPFTALVPMSTISKVERQSIPGIYYYGQPSETKNDTSPSPPSALIITGASISGDYHSPNTTLWFQIFAIARIFFETNEAMDACYSRDGKIQMEDVQPWDVIKDETFLCRIGTRDAYFELMPSNGVDTNTNELIQVWRCPLYDSVSNKANILSDNDFQAFHYRLNEELGEELALPIEILHGSGREVQESKPVVKLYLPISEPNIGINQIRSHAPAESKPFLSQQRHNITLCVVSHVNAISHWNGFIRYHHDVVGIDHIHMALYTTFGEGQKDKTNQLYQLINRNFKHDINEGILSVSALWDDDFGIRCPDQEFPKINFYQQCLYRAKSTSEFVATWDMDEYFLFHNLNDSHTHRNLPDFLRQIDRPQCQDWCFVTMKSSFAGFGGGYGTGIVALDYTKRTKDLNTVWAKSISRTKSVFLNSYHLPGACLPPGTRDLVNTVVFDPSDGDRCGFFIDEAIMVHVRGMQFGINELGDEETVKNELLDAFLSKY